MPRPAALSLDFTPKPGMRIYRVACGGEAIRASMPKVDANGQPVQAYTKAILRAGATVRNVRGDQVTIQTGTLDAIAATFGKMIAAGIKVPVQAGHNFEPDKTRGWVTDVWREGDLLQARLEMIGDDGIALASRSDVSVYVDPSHERDGTVYTDALLHVACTPIPQVTGLGEFKIAASLEPFVFSTDQPAKDTTMNWKDLALILGIDPAKFDDTTGPAEVTKVAKAIVAEKTAIAASLAKANETVGTLQLSVTRLQAGETNVEPAILDELADLTTQQLDGLVSRRAITPAQKDKFAELFAGKSGARPVLCLSATAAKARGLPNSIAKSVIEILSLGAGSSVGGSKTGSQTPPAGNGSGDGDTLDADERKAFQDSVAAAAA